MPADLRPRRRQRDLVAAQPALFQLVRPLTTRSMSIARSCFSSRCRNRRIVVSSGLRPAPLPRRQPADLGAVCSSVLRIIKSLRELRVNTHCKSLTLLVLIWHASALQTVAHRIVGGLFGRLAELSSLRDRHPPLTRPGRGGRLLAGLHKRSAIGGFWNGTQACRAGSWQRDSEERGVPALDSSHVRILLRHFDFGDAQ